MIDYQRLKRAIPQTDLQLIFQETGNRKTVSDGNKGNSKEDRKEAKELKRRCDVREKIKSRIRSRIQDGLDKNMRHEYFYRAIDIAQDGPPINKQLIPLMQLAQGNIRAEDLSRHVRSLIEKNDPAVNEIFEKCEDKATGKTVYRVRSTPKVWEMVVSLVKSYITRRHAAQVNRLTNWPYFEYFPRNPSMKGQLIADIMSQTSDIIADGMGYRHTFVQYHRDPFLYGWSCIFPKEFWLQETSVYEVEPGVFQTNLDRFGIDYDNPHPTRIIYDSSKPLAKINQGSIGPQWIAYWDIVRVRDLPDTIWNRDSIPYASEKLTSSISGNSLYFSYYYADDLMKGLPGLGDAYRNDRKTDKACYSSSEVKDSAVFLTYYYEYINPKEEGIGEWNGNVWIRYTVANDGCIVNAEWCPYSIPCAYGGINQNDSRLVSTSPAHELMGYQDQMTRILTQMLRDMQVSLMQIWAIDEDMLGEEEKKYIRASIEDGSMYMKPKAFFYKGFDARSMELNGRDFIKQIRVEMSRSINESFTAIFNLFSMVEKMQIMSPQELGQAAPRIITASENRAIEVSTDAMYRFIGHGLDEQRNAVKQMIYEGVRNCLSHDVEIPVAGFYPDELFDETGMEVVERGMDNAVTTSGRRERVLAVKIKRSTLAYPLRFDSRDINQKIDDQQKAQNLIQMVQILASTFGSDQELWDRIGKPRVATLVNMIARTAGTPADFQIDMNQLEAETRSAISDPDINSRMTRVEQMLGELVNALGARGRQQQPSEAVVAEGALPEGSPDISEEVVLP